MCQRGPRGPRGWIRSLFLAACIVLVAWSNQAQSQVLVEEEPWPSTLEEAVAAILSELPEPEQNKLRDMEKDDLILLHHGFGTGIRNGFGLWAGNRTLLQSVCGGQLCHPDTASMILIEAAWEFLQGDN